MESLPSDVEYTNKNVNFLLYKEGISSDYFVIPYSSTHYLTESDLRGLNAEELEIAKHSYIFVIDQ
ncbi:hypothetical protein [Clostridium massiliamazoniense]|uniref:hypothetical protein n=1 Tax=Clostridium massiliamazoniense TaxID=1347366 RepID=UPI000ABDC820|nr:hypothetical protein [Clostridium massiliamazoniense]